MSFYPRLFEAVQKADPDRLYTKGTGNTFLLRKLVDKYPKKYKFSTGVRIENIAKTPVEEFKNDFIEVADEYGVPIVKNTVRFAYPGQPGAVSGKFPGLRFELDGKDYGVKYSGVSAGGQMTQTPTVFKEGMVVYFFQTDKTYTPFKKTGREEEKQTNYRTTIDAIVTDIKANSIHGMDKKDVDYMLRVLENEGQQWNLELANSIFNAMSVGKKLKESQFGDWEIYRDKFFNDMKKRAAKDLGFAANAVDKWNPMDIMLIKPGKKGELEKAWDDAAALETEILKLGHYNNFFVDELDTNNEDSIALAVSLKEQSAQGGKGKSYIARVEKVSDRYNLTKDEQSWPTDRLMDEITKQRQKTPTLISNLADSQIFNYAPEQPADGFNIPEAAKAKYGSLKLLNYLLEKTAEDADSNMFINLAAYSLSLGQNPTFFKFQGNKDGDPNSVHVYRFPQKGGVTLYNKEYENYDGKITIRDGNNNAGIEIRYYIATAGILYSVVIQIRANQGTRRVDKNIQVNIEVQKITEIEDLNEEVHLVFYPRLFEAFEEESDPIEDMGIGALKFDVEMKGDFEGSEQYEKKKVKNWIFNDIQVLTVEGSIDTESAYLEFNFTNNDRLIFEDFYSSGGPMRDDNNYAYITLQTPEVYKFNVTEEFMELLEQYGGVAYNVLKLYEKIKSKRIKNGVKESVNETFKEESDPIVDLGIGPLYQYFTVKSSTFADSLVHHFIEKGPIFVEERKPTTYTYSEEKGNVYRKHPNRWAPQELRSNSRAFNKGNPDKMAIPHDLDKAKEFILKHYLMKRKKAGLKESLNEKFTEVSDPVTDMGVGIFARMPKIGEMKPQEFDLKGLAKTICNVYALPIKNYTPVDEKSNYNWTDGYQNQFITMNLNIDTRVFAKFLGPDYYDRIKSLMGKDYIAPMKLGITSSQKHWISKNGGGYEFDGNSVYVFVDAGGYSIDKDFAKQSNISDWLPDNVKDKVMKQTIWDLKYRKPTLFYEKTPMGRHMNDKEHVKLDVKDFCKKYGQKELEDLMRQNYMWNTAVRPSDWKITNGVLEFISY